MLQPDDERRYRWWELELDNYSMAQLVWGVCKQLEEQAKDRHQMDARHLRLYGGSKTNFVQPQGLFSLTAAEKVAWNVIAASINTYVAKITKARPAPFFVTNGADYDTRRKALKLNKFGRGLLHQMRAYETSAEVERDAAIFGTCPVKIFSENKTIKMEKVFPWELFVDDVEAMYGRPRTMAQRKFIDKDELVSMFPDKEAEICNSTRAEHTGWGKHISNQREVWEIWRLPSGPDKKDGRHIILVERAVLADQEWTRNRFPFVFRRWEPPVVGFWGVGVAERITGIQLEINKLLRRIKEAHHLLGRPLVILPEAAGIPVSHLTNEVGAILVSEAGMGDPINVHAPPTMPPDVYVHLERLRQSAFEEIGVSQLSVASRKPAGIESGAALREYNDIETERFLDKGRSREVWFMEVVEVGLEEAKTIEGYRIDVPDNKERVEVEWKDINLEREAYTIQVFPVSALPQHPSGRLQKIQELVQSRMLPVDRAYDLMEIPDLDDYRNERMAADDAIRSNIAKILDGEGYTPPESYDNLSRIVELGTSIYLREREAGAPQGRLAQLRQYMNDAHAQLEEMKRAVMQQQATQQPVQEAQQVQQ